MVAAVALLSIAGLWLLGWAAYESQKRDRVAHGLTELSALGASQVAFLDAWARERLADVAVAAPSVADYFGGGVPGRDDPSADVRDLAGRTMRAFGFEAVGLVGPAGVVEVGVSVSPEILAERSIVPPQVSGALGEAHRSGAASALVSVPARIAGEGEGTVPSGPHLVYFVAPVRGGDGEYLGGLVFVTAPSEAQLPRALAMKDRIGHEEGETETLVVHEAGGRVMVVASDPPSEARFLDAAVAPPPEGAEGAEGGVTWRRVERDADGREMLAVGAWSRELGLGFVNRQPLNETVRTLRETTLLALGVVTFAVLAVAAMSLAWWRGARLREANRSRDSERERARLELRVAEAARLEAVGRMAGEVAHRLNNLLAVVVGHLDLAEGAVSRSEAASDLRVARDAARGAERLGRELLEVSGDATLALEAVDVGSIVSRTAERLALGVGEGVRLEGAVAEGLPPILADRAAVEGVCESLILNALEAVGEAGRVGVSLYRQAVGVPFWAANGEVGAGDYLVLRVEDDGPGVAARDRARIFDPYFTTKTGRRHVGLGLTASLGAVARLGGGIVASSKPGDGAVFDVYLPLREVRAESGGGGATSPVPSATGPEARTGARPTVLVVDDEPGVRSFVCRALEARGHRVVSAASAAEARSRHEELGRVDLLVSDVLMPHENGYELLAALRRAQPDLPAILVSGYTDGAVHGRGEKPSRSAFLAKPFTMGELLGLTETLLADEVRLGE